MTYEEMKSQATKLAAGRQEIESKLNELKGQVDSLVSGGFVTDSASAAFQSSYDEFSKGASQTIEGLDGMGNYLNKAAEAFQSVDSELASALKG
ncbi:WXG100 family type VII secretion target [Nocardioides donggukensis]|uniref:WXG100 family type VII secretion target n=1 Tax=Nocardioides donggukensis TaxID=2774019 RepID=UPI00192034BC|nr:WXG100 family type VII secretion target [Nocardioides donggukensis]